MKHWQAYGPNHAPHALELGTGWYPVVPIGLFLLGAERVTTVDIDPLMSDEAPLQTAHCYLNLLDQGRLGDVEAERVEHLRAALDAARSGADLLERLGIEALVADASALPLQPESVDLFVSNNTLEHVPEASIIEIFAEFARVARPDARMSHFVDMADHYALFDDSITVFNYMRYSDAQWRLFNNSLHYQNRLRASDYRRLHTDAGWQVMREAPTEGSDEQLARVRLAPAFAQYSDRDLLVFESWFVAKLG